MAGMPVMTLLFRCFRCQQVLKTSRSKVGSVVHCVKCGVELIVPEPPPPSPSGSGADGGDPESIADAPTREVSIHTRPGGPSPLDLRLETDVIDIRPEDIRAQVQADPPTRTGRRPDSEEFERIVRTAPVPVRPEPVPLPETALTPPPVAPRVAAPEPAPTPALPPIVVASEPFRAEPTISTPEMTARARRRDVSIPRATVVAWSWLVLLALAFAFLAGLLAGHYLWVDRVIPRG